jgi:predicted aconitase with swiveling domain
MPSQKTQHGRSLVPGTATGNILWTDTPISFYGGVNPATGIIIDRHHQIDGQSLKRRILALPAGRGSCAGSAGIL